MKTEVRDVDVSLNRTPSFVYDTSCLCLGGKSGYCNHAMTLLSELTHYSLHQLKNVPKEVACTSRERWWGVPGQKSQSKELVMTTYTIQLDA